jgi:hypothetical protein
MPAPLPAAAPEPEPVTAPPESPSVAPPPAPAPLPPPLVAAESEFPKRLAVGKSGFFQPSALLQFWFFLQNQDNDDVYPPSDTSTTLRIRRAELRIKGEIVPKTVGYMVMIDPARALEAEPANIPVSNAAPEDPMGAPPSVSVLQPPGGTSSIFQDFAISFLSDYADVSLGQFKIPVSYEGVNSSSKLLFPERSLVSRRYGDRRDIGVKAEKKLDKLYYYAGVFNGQGQNRLDTNNQKDAALRLEVYPVESLMIGAVGYLAVGERDLPGTKDRVEGDLKLELEGALLQAEYIYAWDRNATERVPGHGLAVAAGYTFGDKVQPVARFGLLDTNLDDDVSGSGDEVMSYELGVNYFISGHETKAQLGLGLFDFDENPTLYQVTLAAQVSF